MNYIVQKESLESVADSIRAKAGISEKLVFPNGWKAAVEGITGSGGSSHRNVNSLVDLSDMGAAVILPSGVELYYNHEYLPEIPADIVEEYPYVVIARTPTMTRIYASTSKMYFSTADSGNGRVILPGPYTRATLNTVANAWLQDWSSESNSWLGVDGAEENFAIWWSNYDVPNGAPDATEIYFPACEPKTEKPADATRFYYNGVRLPKIPEDVLAQYPYAWIRNNKTSGYYDLLLCGSKRYYSSGIYPSDTCQWYRIEIASANGATEWSYYTENNNVYGIDSDRPVLWSNHDIPNGSATASKVYRYGTLPVPTE